MRTLVLSALVASSVGVHSASSPLLGAVQSVLNSVQQDATPSVSWCKPVAERHANLALSLASTVDGDKRELMQSTASADRADLAEQHSATTPAKESALASLLSLRRESQSEGEVLVDRMSAVLELEQGIAKGMSQTCQNLMQAEKDGAEMRITVVNDLTKAVQMMSDSGMKAPVPATSAPAPAPQTEPQAEPQAEAEQDDTDAADAADAVATDAAPSFVQVKATRRAGRQTAMASPRAKLQARLHSLATSFKAGASKEQEFVQWCNDETSSTAGAHTERGKEVTRLRTLVKSHTGAMSFLDSRLASLSKEMPQTAADETAIKAQAETTKASMTKSSRDLGLSGKMLTKVATSLPKGTNAALITLLQSVSAKFAAAAAASGKSAESVEQSLAASSQQLQDVTTAVHEASLALAQFKGDHAEEVQELQDELSSVKEEETELSSYMVELKSTCQKDTIGADKARQSKELHAVEGAEEVVAGRSADDDAVDADEDEGKSLRGVKRSALERAALAMGVSA